MGTEKYTSIIFREGLRVVGRTALFLAGFDPGGVFRGPRVQTLTLFLLELGAL